MKTTSFYLVIFILFLSSSSYAQYVNYQVKVVLDSVQSIKGSLQKITPEGIAIEDFMGNYRIFKAQNIIKIKVKRKGLTFTESLVGGTGLGLATGLTVFKDSHNAGEAIVGTALLTGAGLVGGTATGIIAEAINTKLILYINLDVKKFQKEYKKLEKYSKDHFFN